MDIEKLRSETSTFSRGITYLDHAAGSVPPFPVIESMKKYLKDLAEKGPVHPRLYDESMKKVSETKQKLAKFINAKGEEEIAFVKTGSEAISILADGLKLRKDDEVIVDALEITPGFVPWLRLKKETGIKVKILKIDKDGLLNVNELQELVTPKTKLILALHISNLLGTLQPVEQIGRIAKENQALYVVNACESLGQLEVDIQKLKCDFIFAPFRKWLRGPQGLALLFCRKELINKIEPASIGWNTTRWVSDEGYAHMNTCERFEAGEPNFLAVAGLSRAVDYVSEAGGLQAIRARIKKLTRYLLEKLDAVKGLEIYGIKDENLRGGIVSFNLKKVAPRKVSEKLAEKNVVIEAGTFAARLALNTFGLKECARVCVHYFNDETDIDRFVENLKNVK